MNDSLTLVEGSKNASLVTTVYSHTAGGACRRGGRQPQVSDSGGLCAPACGGNLFCFFFGGPPRVGDFRHYSRRDGQNWPGISSAHFSSPGGMGGPRPRGRVRRQPV